MDTILKKSVDGLAVVCAVVIVGITSVLCVVLLPFLAIAAWLFERELIVRKD